MILQQEQTNTRENWGEIQARFRWQTQPGSVLAMGGLCSGYLTHGDVHSRKVSLMDTCEKKFILPWGSWVVGHANEIGHSINFSLKNVAFKLARRWVGECCWIMEGTGSSWESFLLVPVDKDFLPEGSSRFASQNVCLLCHLYTDNVRTPFLFSYFFYFFSSTFYKESTENHFVLFWNFGFFCFSAFPLDYVPDIIAKKLNNTSRDWEN